MNHVGTAALGCPVERSSTAILLALLLALTSACRIDMHVQPRENPLSRSDFYADQRSERPLVEGTVARGPASQASDARLQISNMQGVTTLAALYPTLPRLREAPELEPFLRWVRKQPPSRRKRNAPRRRKL